MKPNKKDFLTNLVEETQDFYLAEILFTLRSANNQLANVISKNNGLTEKNKKEITDYLGSAIANYISFKNEIDNETDIAQKIQDILYEIDNKLDQLLQLAQKNNFHFDAETKREIIDRLNDVLEISDYIAYEISPQQ